jgi:hypothetical protein
VAQNQREDAQKGGRASGIDGTHNNLPMISRIMRPHRRQVCPKYCDDDRAAPNLADTESFKTELAVTNAEPSGMLGDQSR